MLRFLLKKDYNFLQKCVFFQSRRNLINKDTSSVSTQKGKDSNTTIIKKIKSNLTLIKDSLVVRDVDDILIEWMDRPPILPENCDVVIIGGGVIGSSIAYWLKQRVYTSDFKVIVVEKDPMYTTASTVLSAGGLRQQFSLKENIEMSLFGAEFIRNVNEYLGIDGEPKINTYFHPHGYLILASEKGAQTLIKNSKLQNFLGAKNILLSSAKLKDIFPWLNIEDVELGCLGLEKEGWFDPWALLSAFKKKALLLGANYICGEAQGFTYKDDKNEERLDKLIIKTKEGEIHNIRFSIAIVAAGAFSGKVAEMAKLGTGNGLLQISLPVEPRKRYVYCFHCPDGPGLNTPLTIDYSGTYFRREGLAGTFICGRSPEESEEPTIEDLSVDYDYFDEKVWPILAQRVPVFEKLKLKSSWAGYYEYNTFDQNGIIGKHPFYQNLLFATGFSGHGIQQAPAVGRAVSELIIDGEYTTIDLSNLSFDRIIKCTPTYEANII
ncbi:FAD-dependent oxidoreductase domain-containing protein 1 isoform X1 [Apis cerana]|uniref:FAD-dependent oxidoreductase domain-containing protein 1 n=2 Tax=Apis cerana TaxID=7461 RepID=A0A2A3E1M2_APICC|nr:FAD-dependent oxidoreductase domain-containing protein 1 isoform X1 [Apis cerana]PBC25597.1 FAD-dependent oxidoreductase domain-containing protein [Apis cerana cerana]